MKTPNRKWPFARIMRAKAPGIALMDVLFAMLILGIIVAMMAPGIKYAMNRVNRFSTDRIMDKIEFALSQYSLDMGSFPGKREGGLTALVLRPEINAHDWKGPYLDGVKLAGDANTGIEIMDKWNRAIEYNRPPVNFAKKYRQYEIVSFGPNEDDASGYIDRGQ
jgi:type II secretion system protein G